MSNSIGTEYQRNYFREIVHAKAEILIDGNWHNCVILNISNVGAKLRVDPHIDVGKLELLKISKIGQFRTNFTWRQRDEIGVEFAHDAPEITGVTMELTSSK